jgi:hypothetical protein
MRPIIGSSISRMLFAALTVFAVSAIPTVAQEASGKFTLAKEVRWGAAVLPAGEYTYTLEHQTGQVLFVRNVNGRANAIVLVKSVSLVGEREHDRLVLQRSGDDWFVSSMVITNLGQQLSFRPPSTHREQATKVAALSTP